MPNKSDKWFDIFVGSETGLLKGVKLDKKSWVNVNALDTAGKNREVNAMCWSPENTSELCLGLKNQTVDVYDTDNDCLNETHDFSGGGGTFRGLAKIDGDFLTCTSEGLLKLWKEDPLTIDVGKDIYKMRQNPTDPSCIATGGKENDLKVYNLGLPDEPVFKAKNVRNDFLDLRVPVWVTDMAFLPNSEKVVTCTGHHQVRVYDPSTPQRRPVFDVEYGDYPFTCMCLRPGRNQVLVGNTQGTMALIDLRKKGAPVNIYKGFAGSIRQIECHPSLDYVATCGIDRHLRVHNITSRALVHKIYLKSKLNCLALSKHWKHMKTPIENTEVADEVKTNNEEIPEDSSESEDDDQMWAKIEEVASRKRKIAPQDTEADALQKQTEIGEENVELKTKKKKSKKRKDEKGDTENVEPVDTSIDESAAENGEVRKKKKKKSKKDKQTDESALESEAIAIDEESIEENAEVKKKKKKSKKAKENIDIGYHEVDQQTSKPSKKKKKKKSEV